MITWSLRCRKPHDNQTETEMVRCEICEDWFHMNSDCVKPSESRYIGDTKQLFVCKDCFARTPLLHPYLALAVTTPPARVGDDEDNAATQTVASQHSASATPGVERRSSDIGAHADDDDSDASDVAASDGDDDIPDDVQCRRPDAVREVSTSTTTAAANTDTVCVVERFS
jgi:hypothetical protein